MGSLDHFNLPIRRYLLRSQGAELIDEGREERPAALDIRPRRSELRCYGDGENPGNRSIISTRPLSRIRRKYTGNDTGDRAPGKAV